MREIILVSLFAIFASCSASSIQEEMELASEVKEQSANAISSSVNVSDIALFLSTPYRVEGAGYHGNNFGNLEENRNLRFTHVSGKSDSEALNDMITNLSNLGGGKILIQKGDYKFKNVLLKSNIHLTIASEVTIKMDNSIRGKNFMFNIGMVENEPLVNNIRIVGLGSPENRPKLILEKFTNGFYRAIALGYVKNALIENITIEDVLTKGAAIAFNPVKINEYTANIAENVTVTNVEMRGASIGYGLVQTNVGKNILLRNLSCQGGMTCRIEAHTGRQYDLGVDNIVIKNVVSIKGKAAVLLQPHSVLNGRVLVDMAKSEGSSWTLYLKEGFVGADSKRREKGNFAPSSSFKNISLVSTDNTATLSFKNYNRYVPGNLKNLYETPDFTYIENDCNHSFTNGVLNSEAPIVGPSIAVIFIDASYALNLPLKRDISLIGKTENRLKILDLR